MNHLSQQCRLCLHGRSDFSAPGLWRQLTVDGSRFDFDYFCIIMKRMLEHFVQRRVSFSMSAIFSLLPSQSIPVSCVSRNQIPCIRSEQIAAAMKSCVEDDKHSHTLLSAFKLQVIHWLSVLPRT